MKYSARMLFRHFRRNQRMTQRHLAIALKVTTREVQYIEAGSKFPSPKLMQRFKDLVAIHEVEQEMAVMRNNWLESVRKNPCA